MTPPALTGMLTGVIAVVLTGCAVLSDGDPFGEVEPAVLDAAAFPGPVRGGGILRILAWPGAVEDGQTRPDVDWVTAFEQDTGCEVQADTFRSSDEGVQRFVAEDYDVILMSGDSTLRLIYGNVAAPLNLELLPAVAGLTPDLLGAPWNSLAGRQYGVPSGRSAMLLQSRDAADVPTGGAATLWRPPASLAGRLAVYDSPMTIADAAVYLMSARPKLGISNPYALSSEQFSEALALIADQAPSVGYYWSDYVALAQRIVAGEIDLAMAVRGTGRITGADRVPTTFRLPATGSTGWSDSWLIRNATPNPGCAYLWLDWVSTPAVNGAIAQWLGDAPAALAACDEPALREHCRSYRARDTRFWSRVWYYTTPLTECLDGRTDVTCVPYAEWAVQWARIRAAN